MALALLSLKRSVWFVVDTVSVVVILTLTMIETLKWLSSLPIFSAKIILLVTE